MALILQDEGVVCCGADVNGAAGSIALDLAVIFDGQGIACRFGRLGKARYGITRYAASAGKEQCISCSAHLGIAGVHVSSCRAAADGENVLIGRATRRIAAVQGTAYAATAEGERIF